MATATTLVTEADLAEMTDALAEPTTPSGFTLVHEAIKYADRHVTIYFAIYRTPQERYIAFEYETSNITFDQVEGREVKPEDVFEVIARQEGTATSFYRAPAAA